jgi:hypothetical protein
MCRRGKSWAKTYDEGMTQPNPNAKGTQFLYSFLNFLKEIHTLNIIRSTHPMAKSGIQLRGGIELSQIRLRVPVSPQVPSSTPRGSEFLKI